jgi:hypothetical protein
MVAIRIRAKNECRTATLPQSHNFLFLQQTGMEVPKKKVQDLWARYLKSLRKKKKDDQYTAFCRKTGGGYIPPALDGNILKTVFFHTSLFCVYFTVQIGEVVLVHSSTFTGFLDFLRCVSLVYNLTLSSIFFYGTHY